MEQSWLKKLGLSIPIVQEPNLTKGVFEFLPPSAVYTIGSHAIGCTLGPHLNIDIAIEMPMVRKVMKCLSYYVFIN